MLIFVFSTDIIANRGFIKKNMYLVMCFFKTVLISCNFLPSEVYVNIQHLVTESFTGTKFILGLTVCLSHITPKNILGDMMKTSENVKLINQYLFDHNTMSLLFYSRCFLLVEKESIFLSMLLVHGCCIKSPQVGFSVSSINISFQ